MWPMRALLLLIFCGCTPSTSSPPVTVEPAPASFATTASSGGNASEPTRDVPLHQGIGFPPALLERLAKDADAQPAGKLVLNPSPDAERDESIKLRFGRQCRLERTCGPLWGIDCESAVDGPYDYYRVHKDRLEELAMCGGACMSGRCTNCPPKAQGWTCPTY